MKSQIAICGMVFLAMLAGILFTDPSTEWYACVRPSITPPDNAFPLAWTIIYIMIAISFVRTRKDKAIYRLFILNLCLTVLWCYLFFTQKAPKSAFVTIIALWLSIAAIIKMTTDAPTRYMMFVYLAWVTFATVLNWVALRNDEVCKK